MFASFTTLTFSLSSLSRLNHLSSFSLSSCTLQLQQHVLCCSSFMQSSAGLVPEYQYLSCIGKPKTGYRIPGMISQVLSGGERSLASTLFPTQSHTCLDMRSHYWLLLNLLSIRTSDLFNAKLLSSQAVPSLCPTVVWGYSISDAGLHIWLCSNSWGSWETIFPALLFFI